MDKMLKRVTNKKQSSSSGNKSKDNSNTSVPSSSINKRYSADDNFYTYVNRDELYQNCNGNNYYTISNRGDFKRSTRSRTVKQENRDRQIAREDVMFKKFLRVFNSGENSRAAKDWFATSANSMMDFAPKILTKRFCGRKGDNELYRSNSFKFERFERIDSDTLTTSKKSPVSRQISLCDDYSLPIDFVNKRPLSLDSGSFWSAPSPNGENVEVLNLYCDPKDSKTQLNSDDVVVHEASTEVFDKLKLYSVVHKEHKEYCRPYRDTSDDGEHEDDEPELYENLKHRKLTGLATLSRSTSKSNTYTEVRKSPYYYSDLLKRSQSEEQPDRRRYESNSYRKCQSLDASKGKHDPLSTNSRVIDPSVNSFDIQEEDEEEEEEEKEDMATKQRHMYETAFDSKICQPNETIDLDVVTNRVMERCSPQLPYNPAFCNIPKDSMCSLKRLKNTKNKLNISNKFESSIDSLSQHLTDLDITEQSTLLRGYSSASTSTIPLPQSVSSNLNDSLESFSESSHQGTKIHSDKFFQIPERIKNDSSPIYANSLNNNNISINKNKNINNINNNRHQRHHKHRMSFCYRNDDGYCVSDSPNESRPKSCQLNAKILEIKSRPRERGSRKFSSTESMTTSSSGGSLESIRSSTSEGNRSTTSTDSHHSSSLSSHSSDSAMGNGVYNFSLNFQPGNRFLHQNKMHILSPISDKSFQELGSESSEINRNSNSQKVSPEESKNPDKQEIYSDASAVCKLKKRIPQNKNVATLSVALASSGDVEAQHCSDSGISIESRSDTAKQNQNSDLNDLPFDMPKLRRRRLQQMQLTQSSTQDTSSSTTSVDLKDLPFDMPKLKRKLKSSTQDSTELPLDSSPGAVLAPEEQSGNEANKQPPSLNFSMNRRSLGLSLNLNEVMPPGYSVDTNLPLERQGWYHGAITRMEAENELRNRDEGSYLVRNSESAKNDYSLSLKSAKGFMHMRIQISPESNKFILGQFSSPFDSIPEMIKYYSSNQLPIRGAEHMCLLQPVIAQLL